MARQRLRPSLNEIVRDYVKQYILDHKLSAGDPLPPESQIAEELGVGRGSVREAIKALQSLGVVEVRHGDGLYVRAFSFEPVVETVKYGMRFDAVSLSELAQIRFFLESAAIETAMKNLGQEDIERLEALMNEWKQRLENGRPHMDLDAQFHRILYGSLDNHMFMQLYELFWLAFESLGDPVIKQGRPASQDYQNHRDIVDAIKAEDLERARRHLTYHFDHLLKERIRRAAVDNED
jgi:DNA-binding FadR family transcriptional regulator